MERVSSLIKRLQELQESRASAKSLLATAQLLEQELNTQLRAESTVENALVSVIMPVTFSDQQGSGSGDVTEPGKQAQVTPVLPSQEKPSGIEAGNTKEEKPKVGLSSFLNVPRIEEIPTFAYHQKNGFEVNESIGQKDSSLNDRLKTETKELGNILKETPIKDLKKAIGINDRFVFINELFRGDEDMYERSIKTINSFTILPEAEYWIQRELKTKIGWNEQSETVMHFDQLVRRRFS